MAEFLSSAEFEAYNQLTDQLIVRGIKVGDILECEGGYVLDHPTLKVPILKVQLWSLLDGTGPRWFIRQYGMYKGTTAFVPDLRLKSYVKEGTRFEVVKVSRMSVVLKKTTKPLFPYQGKM